MQFEETLLFHYDLDQMENTHRETDFLLNKDKCDKIEEHLSVNIELKSGNRAPMTTMMATMMVMRNNLVNNLKFGQSKGSSKPSFAASST